MILSFGKLTLILMKEAVVKRFHGRSDFLAASIFLPVFILCFSLGAAAQQCNLSLHRLHAKKNYLQITKKTGEAVIGDYLISHQSGKNKFSVLADSILRAQFTLQPDTGSYMSASRQFTSPKDLSGCASIKLKLFLKATADACLRFTLCDAAGDWNSTLPKYILGHTGGDTLTAVIAFSELQKNSDYGSQSVAGDSARIDLSCVLGYKITVFVPAEGSEQKGDFFIKSIRTYQ
jgi:hypothetical protein